MKDSRLQPERDGRVACSAWLGGRFVALQILSPDLIGLRTRCGRQLWALVKLRKRAKCEVTGKDISGMAWRPEGNAANRWERISEDGMQGIIERTMPPNDTLCDPAHGDAGKPETL